MTQNSPWGFRLCLSRDWNKCRLPLKYKSKHLLCLSCPNKIYHFYVSISVVWIPSKFLVCQLNPTLYYALRCPVPPILVSVALLLAHSLLIHLPDWPAICSCLSCDLTVNPSISFPLLRICALFFLLLSIISLSFDHCLHCVGWEGRI